MTSIGSFFGISAGAGAGAEAPSPRIFCDSVVAVAVGDSAVYILSEEGSSVAWAVLCVFLCVCVCVCPAPA